MAMCEGSHADLMNHDAAVNDRASSPCAVPMRHFPFSQVEIRMFLNSKARFKAGPRHHDDWPMLGSEAILSATRTGLGSSSVDPIRGYHPTAIRH